MRNRKRKRFIVARLLLLAASASYLTGCVALAEPEAMIPDTFDVSRQHPYSVSLEILSYRSQQKNWGFTDGLSDITSEAFEEALTASIKESRAFTGVVESGNGDYLLRVSLVYLHNSGPTADVGPSVILVTDWMLSRVGSGKTYLHESFSTRTSAAQHMALGHNRIRLLYEELARLNIKEGIRRLSLVDLPQRRQAGAIMEVTANSHR